MKFVYQYRTSDNIQMSGTVCAASKDAAYLVLKSQGIRPSRVEEAPGFFNKLIGKGKRWLAIALLSAFAGAAIVMIMRMKHEASVVVQASVSPMPRHYIYGDMALMEKLAKDDFKTVFANPGDRFLAHYAQPGVSSAYVRKEDATNLLGVAESSVVIATDDSREISELKRIVLWMRNEMADYLADGVGTVELYARRLDERQRREAQIYQLARVELENETNMSVWEARNDALRKLGICTIPLPESVR